MSISGRLSLRSQWLATLFMVLVPVLSTPAAAQYRVRNLDANGSLFFCCPPTSFVPVRRDPNIGNAWGLAYLPASPFWISDELNGLSTLYKANGQIVPLVVTVPQSPNDAVGPGSPTGMVANATALGNTPGFMLSAGGNSAPALFIFDTLDGTISGWNPKVNPTNAVIVVDKSADGSVYTGLTIATTSSGTFLYAANAGHNAIERYDTSWALLNTFTDASAPPGYSVYGVQAINNNIYVTYATVPPGKPGVGMVDVFDATGTFIKTLIPVTPGGALNIPWGMALAPANFGTFSNALLVGNLQDGRINAFDPGTGALLGRLRRADGRAIRIPGLWALVFGGGNDNNGKTNQLFFTAGPDNYNGGLFGVIEAIGTP